jgi:broad specificity phosphatase PhoE
MILLRHGQSQFNLHFTATRIDPGIADPPLTATGLAQAEAAATALAGEDVRQIIVSPYTRALQTAAPIAKALDVPVRITTVVREQCHYTCDIGSPRSVLQPAWPEHDFSAIPEIWWQQGSESTQSVAARAAAFRAEMQNDPLGAQTLVVSHWAFILTFCGENLTNGSWVRHDPHG